jgi:hypothetical protein
MRHARLRQGYGVAAFTRFARRDRGLACLAVAREASEGWWASLDSNQEPDRYERNTLVKNSNKISAPDQDHSRLCAFVHAVSDG